ncbi:MAG TPA: winged helix-turn-helix transcriptional regulator [Solirubrobacterales bacterium]|nr:winged helix-turn-helix transcriptional regulator [Solirubrobacterales bacterium]
MHPDSAPYPAGVRAGGTVLSLLAGPLCGPILSAHLGGPLRLPDLREQIGGAAQTTLRGQVGNLRAIGALERHVRSGMPYTVENELTDVGRAILSVAEVVEAWLARAPHGPITFGSELAKGAIRSLVGGWSSTVLRVLAARPLSLTELSDAIPEISYPSLERRLSAMRASRQIEVLKETGKARPYAVTDWTRQAVGPLVAASRCECRHISEGTDPLTEIDIEAAFLLAVPLAVLPMGSTGSCQLVVDIGEDEEREEPEESEEREEPIRQAAGVNVDLQRGEVTTCVSKLEQDPSTWAVGPVEAWAEAIADGRFDNLRVGGRDEDLARGLIESLHRSLSMPG